MLRLRVGVELEGGRRFQSVRRGGVGMCSQPAKNSEPLRIGILLQAALVLAHEDSLLAYSACATYSEFRPYAAQHWHQHDTSGAKE